MLIQALLGFKRWGDETQQAGRFFVVFAALLVELTIDNAFTWYYTWLQNVTCASGQFNMCVNTWQSLSSIIDAT